MDGAGEESEAGPGEVEGEACGFVGAPPGRGGAVEGGEADGDGRDGVEDAFDPGGADRFVILILIGLADGVGEGGAGDAAGEESTVGGEDGGAAHGGQEQEAEEGPEGEAAGEGEDAAGPP